MRCRAGSIYGRAWLFKRREERMTFHQHYVDDTVSSWQVLGKGERRVEPLGFICLRGDKETDNWRTIHIKRHTEMGRDRDKDTQREREKLGNKRTKERTGERYSIRKRKYIHTHTHTHTHTHKQTHTQTNTYTNTHTHTQTHTHKATIAIGDNAMSCVLPNNGYNIFCHISCGMHDRRFNVLYKTSKKYKEYFNLLY